MTNNTSSPIQEDQLETVSNGPYILVVFSIIWAIGANTAILICFFRNRKHIWTIFMALTCSMSATDLTVGLATAPIVISARKDAPLNDFGCLLTFLLMQSAQLSSLVHVLGICIYRSIKINSKRTLSDKLNHSSNRRIVFIITLVSWILPSLVLSCPYIIWGKVNGVLVECTLDPIFGDDLGRFGVFSSIVNGVIQIVTNAMYVITIVRFRQRASRVVVPDSIELGETGQGTSQSNQCVANEGSTVQRTIDAEKRANKTIGILLLVYNVFTIPITIALFFLKGTIQVNRNTRYIVQTLFLMNSGLNSVVYAARIPPIKESLVDIFLDVKRLLRLQ